MHAAEDRGARRRPGRRRRSRGPGRATRGTAVDRYLTTSNAIAVGTLQLLAEDRLADFAGTDIGPAVEELLRLQVGLVGEPFPRYAHEDLTLGGVDVAAGEQVLVRLEAANRDPERFPDPDDFLPGRESGPRLTFGRGPHHCLGPALGRLEVGAALGALARRLPGLRLTGTVEDVVWSRSHADAGPVAVHVAW